MHAASISLIPPGTGGVRDYASTVGGRLQTPLVELTPTTDISKLSGDFLLLHFSGYGFEKRGVPVWLVGKVRDLRTQFKAFGIVFHELFAPAGSPLGSAFWLNGYQKRIARQLLMLSDFWLTNREESGRWLLDHSQAAPHRVLPVFSNVGEPPLVDTAREPRLVVFGSFGVRANVYQWADGEIFRCAKRKGLEIHDIGPAMPDGELAQRLVQEGVVTHGKLSAEDVSHALSSAAYGALSYPTDYVSKSGVFAAYSAHGICPILLWQDYGTHDGLTANVHYAAGFDALEASAIDPRSVGLAARQWYEPHCVNAHVNALRTLITEARK
ncbi:hypothetical protein QTH97_07560 [Variovorax sp. J22R24]|uniref:hypothetical protein n=1 Tax=Variovorax gracilis TaxID=3053502 RepID=UPI0025752BF3|nr:hypothetical protein [Variovorax sp. J22R24]MDM0104784.1 hypothetical protein [Variovorax sp. J22R24]